MKDDSDWEAQESTALNEIGISKEGLPEFEDEIAERCRA